jgi:putative transposase
MLLFSEEVAVMCNKLKERKQAMLMYHVQSLSKAEICRRLNRSRPWLDCWLERYDPGDVEGSLRDHQTGPKHSNSRWSSAIRRQVIDMRITRSQEPEWRYAFIGAKAIHLELKALGSSEVPPVRTIHHWFVEEDLVDHPANQSEEEKESKPIPLPVADAVNRVQQLDLKGPLYLQGSNTRYYLSVLRDRYSHRCAISVLDSREAQGIIDFMVSNWHWLGLPDYLQLDNALEFRGSNRYPRSFGRLVRVAIDLGIEPVFNPPSEPWRNGGIEWFNGFLDKRLLQVKFEDLQAFRAEAQVCQDQCNQIHRLADHDGLTPNEIAAKTSLRLPPKDYLHHQSKKLSQDRGFVSFVRLVRRSGRITLGAGDRFMVDPDLAYQYVLARVDLTQKLMRITHCEQEVKIYDFSTDTVGQWAEDEQQEIPVDDEVVKVRVKV